MTVFPSELARKAWDAAGRVTWTAEDWATFYHCITEAFVRIAAAHVKASITTEAGES